MLPSQVPFFPKLQGDFAEFLQHYSLVALVYSTHLPESVLIRFLSNLFLGLRVTLDNPSNSTIVLFLGTG